MLARDLIRWMATSVAPGARRDEDAFNVLALRVLRYQAEENPVCRALLGSRGLDPHTLERWQDFPLVPTRAFRDFPVFCGAPGTEALHFLTSGTTGGPSARGVHRVRDPELYRQSLLLQGARYLQAGSGSSESRDSAQAGWGAHGGPPAPAPLRVLALLPPPEARPDSSLVHMTGVFHDTWDDGGGGFFADAEWALDLVGFGRALAEAAEAGVPVLAAGTAFAWVHWLDGTDGSSPPLPDGSLLVETGGFKGRSREVPRETLYDELSRALHLPLQRMVNEYGMTEMLSQFYEPVDRLGDVGLAARFHEGPPWVRTRILDPVTLEPVAPGEPGLLAHLDLANLHSASHLLTEDLGIEVTDLAPDPDRPRGSAFRLLGRRPGAVPRGCSLAMEELEEARGSSWAGRPEVEAGSESGRGSAPGSGGSS